MNDLLARARRWMADDPDPATRAELAVLVAGAGDGDPAARAELADRFAADLQFGTAGLRGPLGAGPNRMNRAVVIRTAAGLAAWLHASRRPVSGDRHRVVVGYDARHGSATFATDTAAVLVAADVEVLLLPRALPTPVLAFAVRRLGADAGVMVTASHNPAGDNGYKVYLGGPDAGAQIAPPADTQIAARIASITDVSAIPRADGGWVTVDDGVLRAYLAAAAAVASPGPRAVRLVLTSLHGVGGPVALEALRRAGFVDLHPVPEQATADPDFPTVAFPNPEEPGALDLAIARAQQVGADAVLAHDPDADRCAVALPERSGPGWRILHGDELGAVLGDHLAERGADGVFASTIVSSRLLPRIAAARGLSHATTLTGFKWLARVPGLRYAYEEAIGYCVDPAAVRDKDGISAAVLAAELIAVEKQRGRSLWDRLDDLALVHGLHVTDQLAVRGDDVGAIMDRLRRRPPAAVAGSRVAATTDFRSGADGLPPADVLRYALDDGARLVVRPSGTEPKLKCYLEVVVPVSRRAELAAARRRAGERLHRLRADVATLVAG